MEFNRRLKSLDDGQLEILRHVTKIDRELADLEETLRDTVIEIGGIPDEVGRDPQRLTIRRRLHELENDKATAQAAAAAVSAATTLHKAAAEKRFSRREKLIGLLFAFAVAVGPYLAPHIS